MMAKNVASLLGLACVSILIPAVWSFSLNSPPVFGNGNGKHKHTPFEISGTTVPSLLQQQQQKEEQQDGSRSMDVVVCGAGPGGLLLASHLAQKGVQVAIVDPALDKPWPNNYGVWMDEAECFGYEDCVNAVWKQVGIVFDEDTPELCLHRPYGRIDRIKMKQRLVDECLNHGVLFECAKATNVQHFQNQPSLVTLKKEDCQATIQTLLVADATGFSRSFVKHDTTFDPGYQVTYGARYKVQDLGPYKLNRMVLMDYSERHLYDSPQLLKSNQRFPSFVYVMPLSPTEIFMEETVLVSRPAASSKDLQARLKKRMQALNIQPLQLLEDERAAIPMGGNDPLVPQRTIGFGATSSLVHPASGYMVARAMELAPRVAGEIAPLLVNLRAKINHRSQEEGGEEIINYEKELSKISTQAWTSIWPTDERRQRDFMHFGFELLCLLNPQELRDFFTGFFRLPNALWEHFLSWRLSGIGHVVMGLQVWAQCIPRRFMPAMLIKSIPFIGNRLVGPFLSRGGFETPFVDSLYWDARSDGKDDKWEPEAYYKYLQELGEKEYEVEVGKEKKEKEGMNGQESHQEKVNGKANGNVSQAIPDAKASETVQDQAAEKVPHNIQ